MASADRAYQYDVFLSFHGHETGKGFAYELHRRLKKKKIVTFMDDPTIQIGDVISPTVLTAIEGSKFAIIVLSPKYSSSILCLQELTKITQCMECQNRILPLFFHREYLRRCFQEDFINHEHSEMYNSNKLQEWRKALTKVANFEGPDLKDYKSERELIRKTVEKFENNGGDVEEFEPTNEAMNKPSGVLNSNVNLSNKRARHKITLTTTINNNGPSGNNIGGDGGDSYNGGFAGPGGPGRGNSSMHYGLK